jgi:hypothetical protein
MYSLLSLLMKQNMAIQTDKSAEQYQPQLLTQTLQFWLKAQHMEKQWKFPSFYKLYFDYLTYINWTFKTFLSKHKDEANNSIPSIKI